MATAAGNKVEALMERAAPATSLFEYLVVSTHSKKTGEEEMNTAAAKGFRVVPHTFVNKSSLIAYDVSGVVIMEKAPSASQFYEYKTIGALRTSNFDKQLRAALAEGWNPIDLRYGALVLERLKR